MCGSMWWLWRVLIIAIIVICLGVNLHSIEGIKTNRFINDTTTSNYYRTVPNRTRHYTTTINNKKSSNHLNKSEVVYEHRSVSSPIDLVNNNDVKVVIDNEAIVTPSSYNQYNYERHLEGSSIIFGLARLANESNLNEGCYKALKNIEQSILQREPWAMKILDSSGTKEAGFIFGQNFWLGSREACGAVQKPIGITLSKDYQRIMNRGLIEDVAPFDVNYRVLYMRHHSPWQVEIKLMSERIIHIGLCLPTACSSPEIQELAQDYVEQRQFVDAELYDVHPEVLYMKDLKLSESFYQKISFKLFVGFFIFTAFMILCASILNVKPAAPTQEMEIQKKQKQQTFTTNATTMTTMTSSGESSDQPANETEMSVVNKSPILQNVKDFVRCYDVNRNCEKLFATRESSANEIPVINGLRSISSIWIMLFHVLWYMYFTVDNKPFIIVHAERVFFQYVSSAPLLVDVFFTISGFLQTYNFLRNAKKMETIRESTFSQNARQFFKILFHRYLRLAPLYFVIMGVVDLLSAYIQDVSVFHIHDRFDRICSQHWWRNIIFIQNFFNHQDLCVNWTWSLACEMQFFILATIMLFTYVKHPNFVKLSVITALAASIAWTYISGLSSKFLLSFDVTFATGTEIYINPFVRITPYLLGMLAAWYFIEKQGIFDISQLKEKCLWNLAILVFFSCIYSTYRRDISYFSSISLFVIGRFLFSLSVCWMIIGSATGRGSWWSRLLEAKLFQHINRLTYAIYLLNPFIIALIFSLADTSTHVDPLLLCILASGFAVVVYFASIIFSLAFEVPYCNWSSMMLRRHKQKVA